LSTASIKVDRFTGERELFRILDTDLGIALDFVSRLLPLISRLFLSGEADRDGTDGGEKELDTSISISIVCDLQLEKVAGEKLLH
jgi:hypothetical protein